MHYRHLLQYFLNIIIYQLFEVFDDDDIVDLLSFSIWLQYYKGFYLNVLKILKTYYLVE